MSAGPFRFSDREGPVRRDLAALSDADLVERARALRSTLEDALEAGAVPVETQPRAEYLVERAEGL